MSSHQCTTTMCPQNQGPLGLIGILLVTPLSLCIKVVYTNYSHLLPTKSVPPHDYSSLYSVSYSYTNDHTLIFTYPYRNMNYKKSMPINNKEIVNLYLINVWLPFLLEIWQISENHFQTQISYCKPKLSYIIISYTLKR